MSNLALSQAQSQSVMTAWTQDQIDLLKRTICKGATDDEFRLFTMVCRQKRLDPFARQIYAVKRWSAKENREEMSIQTSIDGFRLIAERTGRYEGQTHPEWCGADGKWVQIWLSDDPPAAARCGVYRTGFKEPLYKVVRWKSFAQTYFDKKTQTQKVSPMWAKMPDGMLHKCAESQALRAAFPEELSGLYTDDEMGQATKEKREIEVPNEPELQNDIQTTKKLDPEREALYRELMPLHKAYTDKFPDVKFSEVLLKKYGVEETKLMSLEELQNLLVFLQAEIALTEAPKNEPKLNRSDLMKKGIDAAIATVETTQEPVEEPSPKFFNSPKPGVDPRYVK